MSAYMVEDKTISRIVTWFAQFVADNPWHKEDWAERALARKIALDTSLPGWQDTLGRKMLALNAAAVNARYGDGAATSERTVSYTYRAARVSNAQALKSLQCWLYQCTEGAVPKKALYRFFREEIRPLLSEIVVEESSDYRGAEWG